VVGRLPPDRSWVAPNISWATARTCCGAQPLRELGKIQRILARLRQTVLDGFDHHQYPFGNLIRQ